MPRTVIPKMTDSGALTTELQDRLNKLISGVERSVIRGAAVATDTSRQVFEQQRSGRPFVDPRPKRATTQGNFTDLIEWVPHRSAGGDLVADLDLAKLESGAPTAYGGPGYWLIQEIGTGNSAYIGGHGAYERRVHIQSQVGRLIPTTLMWSAGTTSTVAGAAATATYGQDQLVPAAAGTFTHGQMTGAGSASAMAISREIHGKHYLHDGGIAGFTEFRRSAIGAAKQAFAGRPWR